MAPMSASPRKRFSHTPSRPTRASGGAATAPPLKKRKYIPGGPGGGGRYIDVDGTETTVLGAGATPTQASAPRPRGRPPNHITIARAVSPTLPSPMTTASRPRRERPEPLQRQYTSAEAAAAAQSDGYKPREERGWEEFHKDLDIEAEFPVFSAEEVDGPIQVAQLGTQVSAALANRPVSASGEAQNGIGPLGNGVESIPAPAPMPITPVKRRPGRPPRRPESMLNGLGSPPAPKIIPLPLHNPKERLNLNKPSFRRVDTFSAFEQDRSVHQNYVDRGMANAGYQESDIFVRPVKTLIRHSDWFNEGDPELPLASKPDANAAPAPNVGIGRVEYDMDEQDDRWLDAYNAHRREEQAEAIKPAIFEITMTLIEKTWHALEKQIPKPSPKPPQTHRPRSSSAAAVSGEPTGDGEEQDAKCAICDDGDAENANAIVFCDGCDLAVHQECYGVPYIPEGQWLCRKCQLIGRGTPTCIFCPNADGAFKQTSNAKWAHLLCSIWIPEVSLGNPSLMEPIMDVEKVPKSRWKLCCYICQQKMGACIQCSSRNCFAAFHVTCAKRARLYLRMKNGPRDPVMLDPGMLHAYCHKHVPGEWAQEHDVMGATADAKTFYRRTMKNRRWANSQRSALSMVPPEPSAIMENWDELAQAGDAVTAGNKRKRGQAQKTVWRLPSGAPIIPQAVFSSVEASMSRFATRKRKEFVAEACKYWTLKREARRGAALLKRLQLQLENFSSMEITRRDFAGMGAVGRPRLQRRIEFADLLQRDMEHIRKLCLQVKERELQKLEDAETLKRIIETVYLPVPPLLRPILEKAQNLDSKNAFAHGLGQVQTRLDQRSYTSVSAFWSDLGAVFGPALALDQPEVVETPFQVNGMDASRGGLSLEQKERKKLARRIVKAIQDPLQDANRKASELNGKQIEELPDFITFWSNRAHNRQGSITASHGGESVYVNGQNGVEEGSAAQGKDSSGHELTDPGTHDAAAPVDHSYPSTAEKASPQHELANGNGEQDHADDVALVEVVEPETHNVPMEDAESQLQREKQVVDIHTTNGTNGESAVPALSNSGSTNPSTSHAEREPFTPPRSEREMALSGRGGVPWYLSAFEPVGTTIHDEDVGQEDLGELSDELSEVDDELNELVDEEMAKTMPMLTGSAVTSPTQKTAPRKARKRYRGFK